MNINIIASWVEIELIKYLIIATTILGLILCIKYLTMGK